MTDSSLAAFINRSIQEINNGLPEGYELSDEIAFEVTVQTSTGSDNKMDFKVIQFGTDEKAEHAHKITFSIVNPSQQEKNALSSAKQVERIISTMILGMVDRFKGIENQQSPIKSETLEKEEPPILISKD